MQLFSEDTTMFLFIYLFYQKKRPQKLLIIGPNVFFSVMPTGPNPAQISIPVPKNLPLRDFSIMTLGPPVSNCSIHTILQSMSKLQLHKMKFVCTLAPQIIWSNEPTFDPLAKQNFYKPIFLLEEILDIYNFVYSVQISHNLPMLLNVHINNWRKFKSFCSQIH